MRSTKLTRRAARSSGTDWWPRIAIISTFVSSVVIASLSLLTSASLQRAQLLWAKQSADAQLEMSRLRADNDKRLQEGALAAQFVQHLVGKDVAQREIAIISLRAAIAPEVCDSILAVVARKDSDADVRAVAIEQLGRSTSPRAAAVLNSIARDRLRPDGERNLAVASNLQVAVRQTIAQASADTNTFVLAATNASEVVPDVSEFTDAIIRGLNGAADEDHDGVVKGSELGQYVAVAVPTMMSWVGFAQQPIWSARGPSDVILTTRASAEFARRRRNVVVLVIAASSGELRLPVLPKEAHAFANDWVKRGARVEVLFGDMATRTTVEKQVDRLAKNAGADNLFVLYLAAPASATTDGQIRWWLTGERDSLAPADINRFIDRIAARNKALFINSCYAGAIERQGAS